MNRLLITAVILAPFFAGAAVARDYPGKDAAVELISKCRQEAIDKSASNVDDYIAACIERVMQYDSSD